MDALRGITEERLYRIYLWGGLAALVIHFVVVVALDAAGIIAVARTADAASFVVIAGPVTLWILGLFVYWWVFLLRGAREFEASLSERSEEVPKIGALKSWGTLQAAMTSYGGDVERALASSRAATWAVYAWFALLTFPVLWVLGCFWAWVFFREALPANFVGDIWARGVIILAILGAVAPFILGKLVRGREENAQLISLGLAPVPDGEAPGGSADGQVKLPRGPVVIAGERHGRPVRIETKGRRCSTAVRASSTGFQVSSADGKLEAGEGAPTAVMDAIRSLRRAKRWRTIQLSAGPDGITVERESRGTNMWLYDLWLIEWLLENLSDQEE
jgi:hypothetical protein